MIKFITILLLVSVSAYSQQYKLAEEYYNNGEVDKALDIYNKLNKNYKNIPFIHKNYFSILLDLKEYKKAHAYIDQAIKKYPKNIIYNVDKGIIYLVSEDKSKEASYFSKIIKKVEKDAAVARQVAQYMVAKQLTQYATDVLVATRNFSGNPMLFSIDLAHIYRVQNKKEEMINEYINFINLNPANINYVKRTLQFVLTKPEDLEMLELMLYDKVQQSPDVTSYFELLIWVNLQQKNFYSAFIQARALDKRKKLEGKQLLSIGKISLQNKDAKNAIKIFQHIIKEYPQGKNIVVAKLYLINARETHVKNTYPIDKNQVRLLVSDYDQYMSDYGENNNTLNAKKNKALLHAYQLHEMDSAINDLQIVVNSRRVSKLLQAEAKLDLGDIYILVGEPWESALLYSQVEKEMKESNVGQMAKLKNARLSYFNGDFALAQEYLDILKMATSREIANDAMELSVFIQENIALDTNTFVMEKYAAAEMLLFKNEKEEAMQKIDSLLENYQGHILTDNLMYLKASILKKEGKFEETAEILELLVIQYGDGVLGDDAFFEMALIYEENLHITEKASELYKEFLTKYPGSIYTAEARKRYRTLRGDYDKIVEEVVPIN